MAETGTREWHMADYELLDEIEGLVDEWGPRVVSVMVPTDERLWDWLSERIPSGENRYGLLGDEELLFGLAVDIRQFLGGVDDEHLDCSAAAVILTGRLQDMTMEHGQYLQSQTPLNIKYREMDRQLDLPGLRQFVEGLDAQAIRRQRIIAKILRWGDDLCELYGRARPLEHYYENDERLFLACHEAALAASLIRPPEHIPVGAGPYGNGVHGPDWKPEDDENKGGK